MLQVEIREKRYPDRGGGSGHLALAGLNLSVADGEFTCLVGPSGCGKSTLLALIAGLDRQVDGSLTLDGEDPARQVSFMFQTPRLMPWLSVLDNVLLVTDQSGAARGRARQLLAEMGLGEVLDAWPNRLSGGMQRRVALARAFVNRPKLLLLDEPFVSLDAPNAARLRTMLLELWQTHRATVLFVTHDLNEALALGDRVLFMSANPGRVVLDERLDLPRPRNPDSPTVLALRGRLLKNHPDLLAGLVEAHQAEEIAASLVDSPIR